MILSLEVDEEGAALVKAALEAEALFWKAVQAPHARAKRRLLIRLVDSVERQIEAAEEDDEHEHDVS